MKSPFFLIIIFLSANLVAARDIYIGAIFFEDEEHLSKNFTKYVNDEFYGLQFIFGAQFVPRVRYAISDDSSILEKLVCELLSDGVVAIFGPSSKTSNGEIVSSICNTYGIPHLLYDYNREETLAEKMERSMTLNVYPENLRLSKIYSSIVQSLDWSPYTIIYDSQEGLARLQDILHLRSVGKTSVKVRSIEADTEFNVMWKEVKGTAERRIILDCSPNIIVDVLRAAKEFNMTSFENRFLITNPDCYCINYTEFLDHNTDITIINLAEDLRDTRDYEDIRTRADRCEKVYETTQMFLLHDAVTLLSESLSALVSKKINPKILRPPLFNCYQRQYWSEGPQILEEMKAVTQPVNGFFRTKQMQYNEFNNREQFELVEEGLNSNTTSIWDSLNMVIKVRKEGSQKQLEYPDLSKETFIIATRIGEPYLRRVVPPNGTILTGNDRYEGYSKDLIAKLAEALGFQFKIEIVEEYGRIDPVTNRWSGIIGKLISNEAHIGICDLTITHERRAAVDFTVPFMSLGIGILYFKETPEPPDLFSFLQPFALEVWVYMKTAYLIVSLLLFIMARIAKNEWENPHPCDREPEELENQWTFKNTSWLTMGSIMGQGCDILPKSGTLRLVCGMWWFFALMMLNSYTANLAAFLTSSRSESSFQSLQDLADSPKIKFGTIRSGSTRVFFKTSNDSLYRSIYSKMETATPSVYTSNNNEGLERVKKGKGKYAFLMETTSMQYLKERNCDVRDVGSPIGEKHYGIAVPLGASYRSQLSVQILKLSERGELSKLKDKWWLNEEKCPSVEKQDSAELSIEQLGGVFLVLGCGLFVAFILGIGEFLWNIQRVAVEDKVTPWEAFKSEIVFAIRFWVARKPVHCAASDTSQAGSRRSSANTNKENSEKCISERNSDNLKLERSSINLTLERNSEKLVAERDSDK